ncbi:hypothetical protein ILUMI_13682 [Ignelater luminosus]|uniref:RRM domain-containing protein n=1 Tax=Ignelater luminosus TaxID=2038154 RepID=A0A8K0CRT3_IGNLU|nr:hypothetical protein ILUMI_13682 [Ignelater luminosus]
MANTYNEWQQWLNQLPEGHGIDPQLVDWSYQKALQLLDTYKTFEDNLITVKDDEELFLEYIKYINAVTDPATILCLYERAVADLSLHTSLWVKYCLYTFDLGEVSLTVSKRAVRNCPWCEELWVMRLRILEQQQCSSQEVTACFEQGLVAIAPSQGLNLWLSYLEYKRRTSDAPEHLHKAFAQASEQLGETGDPTCIVLRLQARLYAHQKDMPNARRIWSTILHSSTHKGVASAWLEYANLEKQYGDSHHLRALYHRALSSCIEWSQYIADDWIMYERECGSLKDVLKCEKKCKKVIEANQKLLSKRELEDYENRKRPHESSSKEGNSKMKRQKTAEMSKKAIPRKQVAVSDIDSEKAVFVSNMREDVDEEKLQTFFPTAVAICIPTDRKGSSRCYAYVQFSEKDEVDKALKRDREPVDGRPLFISKCLLDQTQRRNAFKYSTSSERNKLFVRGLPTDFTQEDVEGIFKPHGAIAVRLVLHRSGRSKGLAYVEFNDEEKTNEALKATDQLNVSGHVITVAISAPPPKKTAKSIEEMSAYSAPIRHARSRLQVPLVPRSIQHKNVETAVQGSSKSNADFRKLFLNKP